MRSSVFFPISILVVAAMVAVALSPGFAAQRDLRARLDQVEALGYVIEGEALNGFTDNTGVTSVVIDTGAIPRVRIVSSRPLTGRPPSAGAFVSLPPPIAQVFFNRETLVTITARRASAEPSAQFSAAYFTTGGRASPWAAFTPTDKYADYTFSYTPEPASRQLGALVGIWPDTAGGRGAIEVLRIRIELADNMPG